MKNVTTILLGLATIWLLGFSQCKKNKDAEAQLPPETATGAMTFGCKVNGKVFVPRDGRGRLGLFCRYVNLGSGPGGGWYLSIPATDWVPETIPAVDITTDSLLLVEGMSYDFKLGSNNQPIKGTVQAVYSNGFNSYPKISNEAGSLLIKKFDQSNRIISGTFSFIGTNTANGEKLNITEGRFDIRY
jgi:hypothetical protein